MKILFLVSSMNAGGAERVAATLANAWAEHGHEVVLLATYGRKADSFYQLSPHIDFQWLVDHYRPSRFRALTVLTKLRALRRFMQASRPDVVISFLTNVNVMSLMAGWGLGQPFIVCERTHPVLNESSGRVLRMLRSLLYRRADAVTVQTADGVTALRQAVPGLPLVRDIPNPLPPELLAADLALSGRSDNGRRQLVAMGRLVASKQFDILIRTFAQIADSCAQWDLVIWGEGPERSRLEAQVAALQLQARIQLPGRTASPWQVLSAGHAFALVSKVEGFPNVLLEAMALGLPCIAFDCPSGPAEISRGGQDAILVPAGNETAFVDALRHLLCDSGLRAELAAKAAIRAREAYALPVVLAQWEALFGRLGVPLHGHQSVSGLPVQDRDDLWVVHIISGLGQGGAETVLYRLLSKPSPGYRHTVISMSDEGAFGERFQKAGIHLITLGMPWGRLTPGGLWHLYRFLRSNRPDVVQTWMYHADLIGGVMARLAGIRNVAWGVRNSGQFLHKSSRMTRLVAWTCARVSGFVPAVVISCSQSASRNHVGWGYRDDRMVVIPNGYDLDHWQPDRQARNRIRNELGLSETVPVIGCVGRWNPLKDHANLLKALVILRKTWPQMRCVLVGLGLDSSNTQLTELLRSLDLQDVVMLLGRREDVPEVMNAFDIHALPSCAEAFPNVVAEAMAAGVPCVVTDVGDSALIVQNDGWVVPAQNPEALADGLGRALGALGTESLKQQLDEGRQRIRQQYSLNGMVRRYEDVWTRLTTAGGKMNGLVGSEIHRPRKLLMVINNPAFLLSHRLPVALAAKKAGFEVHIATMDGPEIAEIQGHGLLHHIVSLSRSGTNPIRELGSVIALWRLFRRVRPDIVHAVTIKPVLYGGIAARMAGIPAMVFAISGLGYIFTKPSDRSDLLRWMASRLYRMALKHPCSRVVFQNTSDRDFLMDAGAVKPEQVVLIRGSGVDLDTFCAVPEPDGRLAVLMVSRLLTDKGVREFVEAAQIARQAGKDWRWLLAGSVDPGNPGSIPESELQLWTHNGAIEYLGERRDIAVLYRQVHIAVLPSYREGLPKSLVEAAACGRPVVTTDVPGCRDAIVPGHTGLLVPARDAPALFRAIERLAEDASLRGRMGLAGRQLAESAFAVQGVVREHMQIYAALAGQPEV